MNTANDFEDVAPTLPPANGKRLKAAVLADAVAYAFGLSNGKLLKWNPKAWGTGAVDMEAPRALYAYFAVEWLGLSFIEAAKSIGFDKLSTTRRWEARWMRDREKMLPEWAEAERLLVQAGYTPVPRAEARGRGQTPYRGFGEPRAGTGGPQA